MCRQVTFDGWTSDWKNLVIVLLSTLNWANNSISYFLSLVPSLASSYFGHFSCFFLALLNFIMFTEVSSSNFIIWRITVLLWDNLLAAALWYPTWPPCTMDSTMHLFASQGNFQWRSLLNLQHSTVVFWSWVSSPWLPQDSLKQNQWSHMLWMGFLPAGIIWLPNLKTNPRLPLHRGWMYWFISDNFNPGHLA